MKKQLRITQKFLLFALIPAVAQTCISVQMFKLLATVEALTEKEAKQSLIDRKLVQGMSQMVKVAFAIKAYAAVPDDFTARNLKITSARMDSILSDLGELSVYDPDTHAEIENLVAIASASKKQFLICKGVASQKVKGETNLPPVTPDDFSSGRVFFSNLKEIERILDKETAKLEDTRSKLKIEREQVKQLVWTELILCASLIGILYLIFRFDFLRRFNKLLLLARELALDKPLTEGIGLIGGDELTELSNALIDSANKRRDAVAQKQMMFQMITHDLRSPLMAATLVVDSLIRDRFSSPEHTKQRLDTMQRSLQRVVGLTEDLLILEKLSTGGIELQKVPVNFRETVECAIESVQPLADKKPCRIENQAASFLVSIDEDRVLQVLVNLLANAIKFSPAESLIEVVAILKSECVEVEVRDRGPGIDESDAKRLFEPFKQGSDGQNAAGFGLGLTIAKMLVELHGGSIGVTPRAGGGSVFFFTLGLKNT